MKSLALALAAVTLPCLAQSQDLTVHVMYKTAAVPASRAIKELAKQSRVDLGVIAPLDSEPLILRLSDIPLKQAMQHIAGALHGRWMQNKTAFTLQRTDDIQQQLEQQLIRERTEKLRKSLDSRSKYRAQTPLDLNEAVAYLRRKKKQQEDEQKEYEQAAVQAQGGVTPAPQKEATEAETKAIADEYQKEQEKGQIDEHFSGDGRLMDRVLAAIDPATIAASRIKRMVFSTDPKPLQYPMSMSEEDFQTLIEEQNIWTQAVKQVDSTDAMSFWSRKNINAADARIVVVVSWEPSYASASYQAYILDSKGRQLVQADDFGSRYNYENEEGNQTDFEKLALPKIKLSPLATEFTSLTAAKRENGADAVRSAGAALRAFLLDAPNRDPLSLMPSEGLLGIAEAKNWNLVALLPDGIATYDYFSRADQVDGAELLTIAEYYGDCKVTAAEGWLTVCPLHPFKSEAERTDRASLSRLLGEVVNAGAASLDCMADFAGANGSETDQSLAQRYVELCEPRIKLFEGCDWDSLHFLGLLSPGQREAMKGERKLPINSLTWEQQAALIPLMVGGSSTSSADYVGILSSQSDESDFSAETSSVLANPEPAGDVPPDPAQFQMSTDEEDTWKPMELEVTEMVDQLPDPAGTVALAAAAGQALRVRITPPPRDASQGNSLAGFSFGHGWESGTVREMWTTPDRLSYQFMRNATGTKLEFATAPKISYELKIRVANKLTLSSSLTEYQKGMTAFGPLEKLPPDLQKRLAKAKQVAKQYESFARQQVPEEHQGTDGAVKQPPPPNA
ncbi:MAG: hypothetical protein QOJ65_1573 [Fimbriimonadaceae bacterium]|jgi:hypothetical protein|nr:hypothetical protein [Fimbriimonadaceae bacterium]